MKQERGDERVKEFFYLSGSTEGIGELLDPASLQKEYRSIIR